MRQTMKRRALYLVIVTWVLFMPRLWVDALSDLPGLAVASAAISDDVCQDACQNHAHVSHDEQGDEAQIGNARLRPVSSVLLTWWPHVALAFQTRIDDDPVQRAFLLADISAPLKLLL